MAFKPRYSDLLSGILDKKQSKCICASEFLSSLKTGREKESCSFGPGCQFEPAECNYNQAACTCFVQCICGPQLNQTTAATNNLATCQLPNCICAGVCLCDSEESISKDKRTTFTCDKTKCICNDCQCKPDSLTTNLFPNNFRNHLKKKAYDMCISDQVIKRECEEIKRLLQDDTKETESCKTKNQSTLEEVKKPLPVNITIAEEEPTQKAVSTNKDEKKKSLLNEGISLEIGEKTILKFTTESHKKSKNIKKEVNLKARKKKQRTIRTNTYTFDQFSRQSTKRRPLRIRYYYSGGVEHYGVKLGHKQCVDKPILVPKHMGWLWNIEDQSKGIRERKGWPPGFIGKSIKNMIKVMKRFDGSDTIQGEVLVGSRWKTLPARGKDPEDTDPKEEPPLLHIHKKGRVYNITFCPKNSDEDVGPIPIPFTITEKKHQSDSESSNSTIEFELHSPKPRGRHQIHKPILEKDEAQIPPILRKSEPSTVATAPSTPKPTSTKKKVIKKKSGLDENKVLWEEQQTVVQNIN